MKQQWLINRSSGNGAGERVLQELNQASLKGISAQAIDFRSLSSQLENAKHCRAIAVAGGDGTFASVLNNLSLPDVPVVTVPLGTANDLAIDLGITRTIAGKQWSDIPNLFDALTETKLATWTLSINGAQKPFCNYVSFGYEGAIVNDFSKWRARTPYQSKLLNKFMYAWFGLKRLRDTLPGVTVTTDNGEEKTVGPKRGFLITNVKSHMGIGISSDQVRADDKMIEFLAPSTLRDYLRMIVSRHKLMGALKPLASSGNLIIKGLPSDTPVQVDGEFLGLCDGQPVEIKFRREVKVLAASKHAL
jgi:diacylglycerol kinase family enzyme